MPSVQNLLVVMATDSDLNFLHLYCCVVFLGTEPDCAVCLPTRASCINVMAGWVLPTLYSFFVTSHMARFLSSAYMPPVNQPTKLLQVNYYYVKIIVRENMCIVHYSDVKV